MSGIVNSLIQPFEMAQMTTTAAATATSTPPTVPLAATAATTAADSTIVIYPKQLPTPSERACELAFITLAEAHSVLPSMPSKGEEATKEQEINGVSYMMSKGLAVKNSTPFLNYLGHFYDIVARKEPPSSLKMQPGSIQHQRYLRDTAITRFQNLCIPQLGDNVQPEYIDEMQTKIKERLINVWGPFDRYVDDHMDKMINSVNIICFDGRFQPLAAIVADCLGQDELLTQFPFIHRPLSSRIISSLKITPEEAINQILAKLDEAEKKKLDATISSTADTVTTSTAISATASQPERRIIVRRHIDQLFNTIVLANLDEVMVSPDQFIAKDKSANEKSVQLAVTPAILHRIGTTAALDEEITIDDLFAMFKNALDS